MIDDNNEFIDCMARMKGDGQPFATATVVRTEDATAAKAGAKAVIRADGTVIGWVGGGCTQGAVKRTAAAVLKDGQARLIRVKPKDMHAEEIIQDGVELHGSSCPSRGTTDIFIEAVLPRPSLIIAGASPVAQALCDLASRLGYVVTVAASTEDLELFSVADKKVDGFNLAAELRVNTSFLVVSTQGKRDREALKAALESDAPYVAFVGSGRKAEALKDRLKGDGVAAERLDALRAPAGLDLGGVMPEEIALSILADIVRERRRGERAEAGGEAQETGVQISSAGCASSQNPVH